MNDSAALSTIMSYLGLLRIGDSPVFQLIGKYGYWIYDAWDTIYQYSMYLHLIIAAIFPIYIAAHASLCQPPSAAKKAEDENEDDEDDELDVHPTVEGLTPSDAIIFPVTASIVLGGLYFFIKLMGDAKLLNQIMTIYFSFLGVFTLAKMLKDGLDLITSFIFPYVWSDGKTTYYISSEKSQQLIAKFDEKRNNIGDVIVQEKTNPFPGFLSKFRFPAKANSFLWALRDVFKKHWILRGYLHGVFSGKQKVHLTSVFGLLLSLVLVTYYNTVRKTWWITNLMGFGFSYTSMQLMSPTTFSTGSLVLAGLFIYDIVMVFYTPMMATVATSLEVPIKLVFPGPTRGSMLGLGDVVLPGIMLTLALRFDLYLHYLRKSQSVLSPGNPSTTAKKASYLEPKAYWGDRFWTRTSPSPIPTTTGASFPKTYFKAGIIGYLLAMVVTLYVCQVAQHPQPALLYLVPGVLTALWGTAWFKQELPLMWKYTEDGEWEWDDEALGIKRAKKRREEKEKEDKNEKDRQKEERKVKREDQHAGMSLFDDESSEEEKKEVVKKKDEEHAHHVFLISLSESKVKTPKKISS